MPPERPDPARGVFETLLVRDGHVQAPEAHVERLARSVGELYGLSLPADLLATVVARAAGLTGAHRLRVDAVPGAGELTILVTVSPVDPDATAPVVCTPVTLLGGLGSHKWADRQLLDSLARPGLVPLLIDEQDQVLEAAWANVWLFEQGRLITPPADGRLLRGVTRSLLLVLAPMQSLDARVEPVSLERLRAASGFFLTSSVRLAVAATLDGAPAAGGEPTTVRLVREALSTSSWA
jgi:para-aminobenzoate synthetase/4-amino-4-deoxychorismate lyase